MAANTRYFVLANYAHKAILVQAPSDRAAAVKKICKAVGVKFISSDLCRGAFDIVVVAEADSFDRVLGLKMAVVASGAVGEVHILEAMDPTAALERAAAAAKVYTPAGWACLARGVGLRAYAAGFGVASDGLAKQMDRYLPRCKVGMSPSGC